MGLVVLVDDGEWEEFDVRLDRWLIPATTDQTLNIKHGVLRIAGQLILGGISDQTISLTSESNIGGSDTVTLVVSNDLNATILVDSNTKTQRGGEVRNGIKMNFDRINKIRLAYGR